MNHPITPKIPLKLKPKYICEHCNESFSNKQNLNRHLKHSCHVAFEQQIDSNQTETIVGGNQTELILQIQQTLTEVVKQQKQTEKIMLEKIGALGQKEKCITINSNFTI
jgi:hypothetical protein